MERDPLIIEAELRHHDRAQIDRQYSYDLTKQLTYFVVSAELIFCGYILLNAKLLGEVNHSSTLFLMAGIAAISGMLWRFTYNINYHSIAHGGEPGSKILKISVFISYYLYIILSVLFFIILLVVGYKYIRTIELQINSSENNASITAENYNSKQHLNK